MNEVPRISDAEWEVMKIIWKTPEITANKIIDELGNSVDWKPNTIKSLISRLLNKNAVDFKKKGKEYFYYPLVSEEECIKAESESFLKKVFDGSINTMMLNFIKSQKLSEKDIEDLKDALNKTEK